MWFICLRSPIVEPGKWTTPGDEHLTWMEEQQEAGSILIAGPGRGEDGREYGIYLIRARSQEEARKIAAADPFTANGHCDFELIEWDVHQILGAGAFTLAGLQAAGKMHPRSDS